MADHDGDPAKQRPECKEWAGRIRCPDMEEVGSGMEGERYRCKVCGSSYFLDYEEMR